MRAVPIVSVPGAVKSVLGRVAALAALAVLAIALQVSSAHALSGKTVNVGTPYESGPPLARTARAGVRIHWPIIARAITRRWISFVPSHIW
jgi:hypothetical protein